MHIEVVALIVILVVLVCAMESRTTAAWRREARAKEAAAKLRRQIEFDTSARDCAAMLDALLRAARYFREIEPDEMTQEGEVFGAVLEAIQRTARGMGGRAEWTIVYKHDDEDER